MIKCIFVCLKLWYISFFPILMKIEFSSQVSKNLKTNFMKIRPGGDELLHADWQKDTPDEANICFSQFWESS
jgi:hypothetical protein